MYWHDILGDALSMYKREGRLSMEVGDTGFGEPGVEHSEMGMIVHEKHWAHVRELVLGPLRDDLRPTWVRAPRRRPPGRSLRARWAMSATR